jgi:LCP family protein required for cell wall assembly
LVLVLAAVVVLGWIATRVWFAWQSLDRVAFAPAEARAALESPEYTYTEPSTTVADSEAEPAPPEENTPSAGTVAESPAEFAAARLAAADEAMEVYLVLGSDQRASLGSSRRADVIMIFIQPTDGSTPLLVSIPRDLYLHNPCTGGMSRVNANLNGCGSYATGPEQVAVAVEDFTGVAIDHFILFTFDGFRNIIERVGGVEVCPSMPVRDGHVDPELDLPAGCSIAGGDQALAWVRSRHTEGFIGGQWVSVASSDLVRNQRQQDIILQALEKVADLSDISQLTAIVEELAGNFTIDDSLSLTDAISRAWNLRSLDLRSIARPVLPVADYIDPDGRWVLVPRATFESLVVAANPLLAPYFTPA